jgi:photosystem II CP43 chlorophyll apoprotein
MRAPTGEIIFGGWNYAILGFPWSVVRTFTWVGLKQTENDIQPWQERRAAEYMTRSFRFFKLGRWCGNRN